MLCNYFDDAARGRYLFREVDNHPKYEGVEVTGWAVDVAGMTLYYTYLGYTGTFAYVPVNDNMLIYGQLGGFEKDLMYVEEMASGD